MRVYLIGVHPDVWNIVCVGVNIPEEDEVITHEENSRFNAICKPLPYFLALCVRKNLTRLMEWTRLSKYGTHSKSTMKAQGKCVKEEFVD
jgi:hypothetical protein